MGNDETLPSAQSEWGHLTFDGCWVVAEVLFVANEDDGYIGAEVLHFRGPLLWYVLEGVRGID